VCVHRSTRRFGQRLPSKASGCDSTSNSEHTHWWLKAGFGGFRRHCVVRREVSCTLEYAHRAMSHLLCARRASRDAWLSHVSDSSLAGGARLKYGESQHEARQVLHVFLPLARPRSSRQTRAWAPERACEHQSARALTLGGARLKSAAESHHEARQVLHVFLPRARPRRACGHESTRFRPLFCLPASGRRQLRRPAFAGLK